MQINRDEFYLWKSSTPYHALMEEVQSNIEMAASEVINRQQSNADRDQYLRGFIQGISALVNWTPDFEKEDKDE